MNEIIEKLKDKNYVRAFGLMTPEEQECFKKVGLNNCIRYAGKKVQDEKNFWERAPETIHFSLLATYVIKPDYQPEPEYVNLEIVKGNDNFLGIHRRIFSNDPPIPFSFTHLHCVPSLSNFDQFWWDSDTGTRFGSVCIENVARLRAEGKKVYARFRK